MAAKKLTLLLVLAAAVLLPLTMAVGAANYTKVIYSGPIAVPEPATQDKGIDAHSYNGYLRLYIVEPTSRYKDYYNTAYSYGLLDFAFNGPISISYTDTLTKSITWDGTAYAPLTESNIMVQAVVLNGQAHQAYSYPAGPSGPFNAYWVEAAAQAIPGETSEDSATGSYTHNVFLDEGSQHN